MKKQKTGATSHDKKGKKSVAKKIQSNRNATEQRQNSNIPKEVNLVMEQLQDKGKRLAGDARKKELAKHIESIKAKFQTKIKANRYVGALKEMEMLFCWGQYSEIHSLKQFTDALGLKEGALNELAKNYKWIEKRNSFEQKFMQYAEEEFAKKQAKRDVNRKEQLRGIMWTVVMRKAKEWLADETHCPVDDKTAMQMIRILAETEGLIKSATNIAVQQNNLMGEILMMPEDKINAIKRLAERIGDGDTTDGEGDTDT